MIKLFIQDTDSAFGDALVDPADATKSANFCRFVKSYYYNSKIRVTATPITPPTPPGPTRTPLSWIAAAYPGKSENFAEFVLLEKGVNGAKEGMWGDSPYVREDTMKGWIDDINTVARAIQAVKDMYLAYEYHKITFVQDTLRTQRLRVANAWRAMDAQVLPAHPMPDINGKKPELGKYANYVSQGLEQGWLNWSRGKADLARTRAEQFMDTHANLLRDKWYVSAEERAKLQNSDPNRYLLIERIEALSAAVAARTT